MQWRELGREVGLGIGMLLLATIVATASVRSAFAQTEMVTVNIPPQELSSALTALADQTQLQLLYASELASGRTTAGVTGTMTPQEATRQLLEGTGLQFTFTDAKTVTLQSAPPAGAAVGGAPIMAEEAKPKPIKVPEIVVKDVRQRDNDAQSYVAEEASTATRTDTPIIQVPQSVGVVTQRVIEDQRAIRLEQALRNVSGLVIGLPEAGSNIDQAFCRGFSCGYFKNNLRNESVQQATQFRDIANIQRLEVLKGPASVLYGRGEPGGIINIVTKQPQAERYNSMEQIFGSYNYYRTMIDSTGPLDKEGKFLYRINAAYENRQSYRDFLFLQRYFVAPVFTWIAGNNTTITVEGEYIHDKSNIDGGFPAIGNGIAQLPRNRNLGEPFDTANGEEGRVSLRVNHRFDDSWHIESQFRYDDARKFGAAAFANSLLPDNRTLTRFFFNPAFDSSSYFWRNDLIGKVSTGFMKHQLLTGVELGRQSTSFDSAFASLGSIDIFAPVYNQTLVPELPLTRASYLFANSVGGYVQDEVAVLDNLNVLIGARGDYFYQHANVSNIDTKAENFGFSPRIGVNYRPIPQVALYSNVTRSFQPVFDPFSAASNIFKPTTATQYEAGIKAEIVPGRLTSTLAVYRILKDDVPVLSPIPGNPFNRIQTGSQRSQGVELDIAAQLIPGWKVIATYAYTDARVTADTVVQVGNRLPLVARHTGSFWSTYDFQGGLLQGFGFGGGVFAVGERAGDINNSFELPGYVRADAALYYRKQEIFPRTNLIAQLNFQNLLNQEYYYGGFQFRGTAALPGAPLSVFGSVKLEFF